LSTAFNQVVDSWHVVKQLALSQRLNYWRWYGSSSLYGLYETQPAAIKGNLVNLTNPDKEVLGYFSAASESSRRYFYKDIQGLDLDFQTYCNEEPLGRKLWKEFGPNDYPVYYFYNSPQHNIRILNYECVDCRLLGGSIVKPDFWPL
jgi:hypothetical protein